MDLDKDPLDKIRVIKEQISIRLRCKELISSNHTKFQTVMIRDIIKSLLERRRELPRYK